MWKVAGTPVATDWLDLEPVRILYAFDGPRIFTCKDNAGNLFLAYQCDEDGEALRFLVVPFSEDLERKLTGGEIDVRDALSGPSVWLFDLGNRWQVLRSWKVETRDLPGDTLPAHGVMLWAHVPPRLNHAKAVGPIRESGEQS
jgi:hypothetical protein